LEITERSSDAVYRLVNTGIYVYNQAPVLRGVNDDQETFNEWHQKMIKYQIRPYYAITTIIKDGLNSRFYVPFEEVEGLVNNYSSRYDGLGRPTIIIPVMGKKLVPGNLKNAMNQNGAYVRNTKSEIWKGTT
jgi:lysine 2,3-aminomutase